MSFKDDRMIDTQIFCDLNFQASFGGDMRNQKPGNLRGCRHNPLKYTQTVQFKMNLHYKNDNILASA